MYDNMYACMLYMCRLNMYDSLIIIFALIILFEYMSGCVMRETFV